MRSLSDPRRKIQLPHIKQRVKKTSKGLSQDWGSQRSQALSAMVFGERGYFVPDTGQRRPRCRLDQTWMGAAESVKVSEIVVTPNLATVPQRKI